MIIIIKKQIQLQMNRKLKKRTTNIWWISTLKIICRTHFLWKKFNEFKTKWFLQRKLATFQNRNQLMHFYWVRALLFQNFILCNNNVFQNQSEINFKYSRIYIILNISVHIGSPTHIIWHRLKFILAGVKYKKKYIF